MSPNKLANLGISISGAVLIPFGFHSQGLAACMFYAGAWSLVVDVWEKIVLEGKR